GRQRPGGTALEGLLHHHPAAVQGRHHRRVDAGADSHRRRVRHPRAAGRPRHADDRPGAVAGVLQQPRLAGGVGGGDGDAGAVAGADHDFPPVPEQGAGVEVVMNGMRTSRLTKLMLAAGFLFLYAPMLSLIVYSFNESRLVTVWSGFSVKWYYEL